MSCFVGMKLLSLWHCYNKQKSQGALFVKQSTRGGNLWEAGFAQKPKFWINPKDFWIFGLIRIKPGIFGFFQKLAKQIDFITWISNDKDMISVLKQ